MKDEIVSFDTAKLAKEKGFNYKGVLIGHSDGNYIYAPTQSLLQRWLREKHDSHIVVITHMNKEDEQFNVKKHNSFRYSLLPKQGGLINMYKTYEQALEAALQEALKLISNESNKQK